jgi:mRNA interferase MazF
MINYQPGELLLIAFPFAGGSQGKTRPALVLLDTGDADVLVARITTQGHHSSFDVPLTDWQAAGLRVPSVVRLHKLATLEKQLVIQQLGHLQSGDRQKIGAILSQTYSAW